MISLHTIGMFLMCMLFLAPHGAAQNLARYRDFEFGMSVVSVAKQAQTDPAAVKTIHDLPELIQTLQWNQPLSRTSSRMDSVWSMRFDFYDDELFRIVTLYDTQQIQGLTTDDLIEAISMLYGPHSTPDATIVVSASAGYEDAQKVLARWEDEDNTYSLFRSSYSGGFGLVATAKRLSLLAAASIRESQRLEALAAPQLESERRHKQEEDRQALEEKARLISKPKFRP
jgi:hypothetical protein